MEVFAIEIAADGFVRFVFSFRGVIFATSIAERGRRGGMDLVIRPR